MGKVAEPQNQNLVNPAKVARVNFSEKPQGFYKALILGIFGVIAAFFVGYAYHGYLHTGHALWLWVGLVVMILFFSCAILQVFLAKHASSRVGFLVLEVVALFVPFLDIWRGLFFGAAAAMFFFLLWGYFASRSELKYGTEIRFFKMTHAVTAKLTTAMLLFVIFFFALMRMGSGDFFMSEGHFLGFFGGSAALFTDFYPSITVNGPFQDFATTVAQDQLSNNPAYLTLAPNLQATVVSSTAATLTTNFSHALGVPISSSSMMSDVLYQFVGTSLTNWHDRFGIWFVVAWALVLFVILRSAGVLFILIAQFLAMIFYEILLASGTIRVVEHPQTKEEVEFS